MVALGFGGVIAVGTVLLLLPISHHNGSGIGVLDCLFTATSATCVTGLVTVSTGDSWTRFGQSVILGMIQVGGLGYMTVATTIALLLGMRMGLQTRLRLKESQGALTLHDAMRVARYAAVGTLLIEGLGALWLIPRLHASHGMPWSRAAFEGTFYSISAFCNAGFDLAPGFAGLSLPAFRADVGMLLVISVLILLGGLGFSVLAEVVALPRTRRLSLHGKLVLAMTAALLAGGMVLFLLFERRNPSTLAGLDGPGLRWATSWFMSVTPRTAGFCPVDLTQVSAPTLFLLGLLMIVGASPGSTAGGVKTTTVAVLVLAMVAVVRKQPDVEVFRRRISSETVRLATALVGLYLLAMLLVGLGVSLAEIALPGLPATADTMTRQSRLVFEVASAFGTVGLSAGITPTLGAISRALIILAMYLGRLGPLAVVFTFGQPAHPALRRLPSGAVMTG